MIQKYVITQNNNVVETLKHIDAGLKRIVFVVDDNGKLKGSVSDGDIRRWIIKSANLDAKVTEFMNKNVRALRYTDRIDRYSFMRNNSLSALPIIDENDCIVDIIFFTNDPSVGNISTRELMKGCPVVIMAGGKGSRLYPYTKILPKPLIPIGEIPILERILNRFAQYGVDRFFLSVNYRKEMIKSYFSELSHEYEIVYIEESEPLGTAGSLRLIDTKFTDPVIVTNCDILIETDYSNILDYHMKSGNNLTIVSSLKNTVIPYGVLETKEDGLVVSMEEKPELSHFINTGMYILDPEYISWIPKRQVFHMTDLVEKMLKQDKRVGMYPISENSFLDMGEFSEMKRMEERINEGYIK